MGWLLCGDRVLAAVEIAESAGSRTRGLLGRDGIQGAILLRPAKAVHSIGMRFPIDVAYLDADLVVRSMVTMVPRRIGRPRLRAKAVLEAEAGSFRRWGLTVGDQLVVADTEHAADSGHPGTAGP